jgi:MSHA pilin protein MshD
MFADRLGERQAGVSLIELIVFIVIVSVGVVGLISVMNPSIRSSADPMVTKQFVAIAESLLNEIEHQPFTSNPQNSSGPTPNTETRNGSTGQFFDNVRDYGGFVTESIADPNGTSLIAGYRAEVAIVAVGASFTLASDAAVAITVTVCRSVAPSAACAGRDSFALTGYRFRYAPRY